MPQEKYQKRIETGVECEAKRPILPCFSLPITQTQFMSYSRVFYAAW
jgi:hypothetical protein